MSDTAVRKVWILPGFTAILVTILLLWLAGTVADLLLLLFLGILLAVYLSALTDLLVSKTRLPRGTAFALAILASLGALFGIGALLIPPVVEQTRQLLTVLPTIVSEWERGLERFLAAIPGMDDVLVPGEHRIFAVALEEAQRLVGTLVPRLFDTLHLGVNLVAVIVMAIYFALRPDLYRDFAVSVTPPKHRDAAAEIIVALSETLRAWTIAQLLAMVTLAALTALGLWLLDVPYWLAFGIFTGLVAVVPFFGTFVSTLVPALFVLPGPDGGVRALLVILLGSVIHIVENQLVVPLLMHKRVDLPPVLTIMSVLICGKLLGPFGLVVSVPMLAIMMVLVRRVLIARVYKDEERAPAVVTPVLTRKERRTLAMRRTAETAAAAAATGEHPSSEAPSTEPPSADPPSVDPPGKATPQ